MSTMYNDKGKIFTNVVSKEAVESIIHTLTHRIKGLVYVRPDSRLKDELNSSEQFVAVTDATIYDAQGQVLFETDFVVVNCDHIIWIFPVEQLIDPDATDDEQGEL